MSSEPDSYILPPNLLITGKKSVSDPALSPPEIADDPDFDLSDALNWYQCRIKLTLEWYRQWRSKYLLELKHFRSRGKSTKQPRIGDVVLIEEQNQKRRKWPLAVVEDTVRGADGRIRLVKLRLAGGKHLNRAIQRVYPLELCETQSAEYESAIRDDENQFIVSLAPGTRKEPRIEPSAAGSGTDATSEEEELEKIDQTANAACRGEDVKTRRTASGRAVRKSARFF